MSQLNSLGHSRSSQTARFGSSQHSSFQSCRSSTPHSFGSTITVQLSFQIFSAIRIWSHQLFISLFQAYPISMVWVPVQFIPLFQVFPISMVWVSQLSSFHLSNQHGLSVPVQFIPLFQVFPISMDLGEPVQFVPNLPSKLHYNTTLLPSVNTLIA